MAHTQEALYSNKIFLNAALPLVKVIANDVPSLKKKFEKEQWKKFMFLTPGSPYFYKLLFGKFRRASRSISHVKTDKLHPGSGYSS